MRDVLALILERDAERAAIADSVRAGLAGRGSALLIDGPLGIGKTALLRAAREADPGMRVLTARGLALEREFSFGIVWQLFEPVRLVSRPGKWDRLFDGAARQARSVFDGAAADDAGPYATTHGLYWLTANLAARKPLLIVVDDLHWADEESLRWLSHLAARIEELPVALVLAARSGPDQPGLIDDLRGLPSCQALTPWPLSATATAVLVRDRLGSSADDALCAACHDSTGGNPFLLHSLLDSLLAGDQHGQPDHSSPGDRKDAGGLPTAEDVTAAGPRVVAEAVLRRTGQLSESAAALIQSVAVLGPVSLRQAAALADLGLPWAARLADALRAANVLTQGSPLESAQPLEFAQPIVAAAIRESMPPGERALAHARAAALLETDGADAERVALHLLGSEPARDPHVVEVLRAAARTASGRGAQDAAADYLRRALSEPPDATVRPALLLEFGRALASTGQPEAIGVLRTAVAQAAPTELPEAAMLSAGALGVWGHYDSALRICREGLDAAGGSDPAMRDRLEDQLFAASWLNSETAGNVWVSVRSGTGDTAASRFRRALAATVAGEGGTTVMALLGTDRNVLPAEYDSPVPLMNLLVLTWNDEFATARRGCDAVLAGARARGSLSTVAAANCLRSEILRRQGNLRDAVGDARLALDFALESSPPLTVAWSAACLMEALARLGRLDEAEEAAAVAAARRPPDGWLHTTLFTQARGLLMLAQQRYAEALDDLLRAAEGWRSLGVTNPAIASWRSAAIIVYAVTSRDDEAAALAAEQVTLARSAGTRMGLGIALRDAARYSSRPVEDLREAVSLLLEADASHDAALALTDLGAHLRRADRRADAQQRLRRALDMAERCGALPLSTYARRELLAAGARPRRTALTGPEALTGAERQVAALAADGMTNRQIAQHLFITQATVETHLRHAYHKLGIASRADLPTGLA
jgi:DNA-binding CsgD family transcriptional regulator